MNLILLQPDDFMDTQNVRLKGRVFKHLTEILKAKKKQILKVGELNGQIGSGEVIEKSRTSITLKVVLNETPPPPSPVRLVMALPRPIVLKRLLPQITALGVKRIVFIQSRRVEKSYWASPVLSEKNLKEQMMLGLEQAKDTMLPRIELRKRFKPFVEDELKDFSKEAGILLAHPGTNKLISRRKGEEVVLVIGPEGGFIPYETELLEKHGSQYVHLGRRILRVETAVIGALSILNSE